MKDDEIKNIEIIDVCYAFDENLWKEAVASISSSFQFLRKEKEYVFWIGTDKKEIYDKVINNLINIKNVKFKYIEIEKDFFNEWEVKKNNNGYTKGIFYRLLIFHKIRIIGKVDKLIYFDCDIIVRCDLDLFYSQDLKGNIFGGFEEPKGRSWKKHSYICSGCMLIDLIQYEEKVWPIVEKDGKEIVKQCTIYSDQDLINRFDCIPLHDTFGNWKKTFNVLIVHATCINKKPTGLKGWDTSYWLKMRSLKD